MKSDCIYFIPLGGCGYFGANLNLFGYNGKWIMVDFGMGFADDTMPGIEILLPNPEFVQTLGDDLLGIVITHGHEDHIGAIQYLWPKVKKPIYATKFTLERIKQAVSEQPWGSKTMLREVPLGGKLELDPFTIDFINVVHSIPQSSSLAISVKGVGTVLHTGDWKFDDEPVEGEVTDEKSFKALGKKGEVIAILGDSTNAMIPGSSKSEFKLQENLIKIFKEIKGAIAVTCFSTNVARLHNIAKAAQKSGRSVCLVGRSLKKIEEIARNCGYLKGISEFIEEEDAEDLNLDKTVYICTGSQGEVRSALARIAAEEHPRIRFGKNTTVIFSSKTIPGNEKSVERIKNNLYALGVNIITEADTHVHVSGHPYRDDIKKLYGWVKPKSIIPVHGEQMQLEKHIDLIEECGVKKHIIPENGNVIEINKSGDLKKVAQVFSGVLAIEGEDRIVPIEHEAILTRRRLMNHGSAIITVVVDRSGKLMAKPVMTALGLLDENQEADAGFIAETIKEVVEAIKAMPKEIRLDDKEMTETIRITARRFLREKFSRNPQTRVHLVRIDQ